MLSEVNRELIRAHIPEQEVSEAEIERVLYMSKRLIMSEKDYFLRERIIAALGYDPEDKYK